MKSIIQLRDINSLSIRIEWSIMLLGFLITDVEDMEVFFNLPLNI